MKLSHRLFAVLLAAILATSALTACTSDTTDDKQPTDSNATDYEANQGTPVAPDEADVQDTTITVVDQIGREVTLEAPAERIVSSYYISTALLLALDEEESLVGIEMLADTRALYLAAAPSLLELPAVGSGKGIDIEMTAALSPDVVILPLKLQDSIPLFDALDIPVLIVNPETQDDFEACITLLATVSGQTDRGTELLDYIQTTMAEAETLTADLTDKPTVYLSAGSDALSTCTSLMYQDSLISTAGGVSVSASLTDSYWATISAEQLLAWAPDYIFAVSYATYPLTEFTENELYTALPAVESAQVYTFPSNLEPWDYPTPSSVLGVLYLTHMLHPELYTEAEYVAEAVAFYQTFFDITVTEADLGL